MPVIRHLDPQLINQIAAGEVVERPASVVKELVENAIDAGATHISVCFRQGGQSLIRIEDNGCGMSDEDLILAVQRHTTSKLSEGLGAISTFGFRGEALAAIASISRMTLSSRTQGQSHGWAISLEGGELIEKKPTSLDIGTVVEVKDLFFATPARLKFMRTPPVEQAHILDVLDKIALAYPHINLTVSYETKKKSYHSGMEARLQDVLGADFISHSFYIQEEKNGYCLEGYLGLPTYHRASGNAQFFFVNHRPVKDKTLASCLRQAFADVTPRDRYPMGVLFLTLPLEEIDVNVHPAKTEVRFLDMRFLHGFVLSALKQGIFLHGGHIQYTPFPKVGVQGEETSSPTPAITTSLSIPTPLPSRHSLGFQIKEPLLNFQRAVMKEDSYSAEPRPVHKELDLGQAIGQIKQSYIVACNSQGLVLVDPHAAHERIVYEKMKEEWGASIGTIHPFLISLRISLTLKEKDQLSHHQKALEQLGFHYKIKEDECHLQAIPEIFKAYDPGELLKDLVSLVQDGMDPGLIIERWRNHMMANWACRQSIKLGQTLSLSEMNALLREIEKTPRSAQCNHGRHVYKEFSLNELSRLFDR